MPKAQEERTGLKSGWCGFPLHDTKQHEGCKEVFKVSGYRDWTCACTCHGEINTDTLKKDRAARTEGI